MYRHRQLIRDYLQVIDYADGGEAVVSRAVQQAAATMGDPADLINVAIEELLRQGFELPTFSTLDRLINRLQSQVDERLYSRVANLLSLTEKEQLDQLLILTEPEIKTPFAEMKQAPASATLSHMRALEAHLDWLEKLLDVSPFIAIMAPQSGAAIGR